MADNVVREHDMRNVFARLFAFWLLFVYPCSPQSAPPQTEQVRLSEILVSTPQPNDPGQIADAKRKANEIRDAIRQGGSFADIARTGSQGPTAAQGGDIGCFAHGNLAETLDTLVFRMKVGNVSDVLRTKQGFVILQVTGRGEQPCPDLELLNQQITAELKPYLERLEEKVRQRWYSLMPSGARAPEKKHGSVTIEFSVNQGGAVTGRKVVSSSGDLDLDEAAVSAVSESSPFSRLPNTTKKNHLLLRFRFEYDPAKPTGL